MKTNHTNPLSQQEYAQKQAIKRRLDEYYSLQQKKNGLKSLNKIKQYLPDDYSLLALKRGTAIAHLDLEPILELIAKGEEFSVVSGLNPSSQLHLGHKVLFDLLKDLQNLGANLFIPITDLESYFDNKQSSVEQAKKITKEKIIPAIKKFNFDEKKTNLYLLSESQEIINFSLELSKHITPEEVKRVFGDDGVDNVGQMFYRGAMQLAQILQPQLPQHGGPKHTLIPVGIDQHPYILLARDIAKKIGMIPPSELVIKFQQSLLDPEKKMSGSKPKTAIYLDDSEEEIRKKINRAYTGSVSILADHRQLGGIPDICSVFSLLNSHCQDDDKVKKLRDQYLSGKLLMKDLKAATIEFIVKTLERFA
ncbi:MAG: tryptophan--tRNA ligase [Candidatus Pacebacteria bacterium]|jgi:tryptophanyl-tRNA synthetase|nr:tryptophan--tRNA ligase [Candidatus Paceibacterota bacterium]MBT3511871.1 tryptophan--tRNA ligase [Candidatus Paceibacterota bacterium]MBT4005358.1 tryptophan--tRNA ligase [Candidatus Paceibacterota bacterium]MBT4359275.1 tryptophan--tRNA ligase [Candidatus Paceibacterota bacterium]MBT4680890.1 tryptophan--tRNA ligase [Candidatus Paceibacterota bacterium]